MFCTKIYIKNKKISEHINKKLFVKIDKCIPMQLQFGVTAAKDINLFVIQMSVIKNVYLIGIPILGFYFMKV